MASPRAMWLALILLCALAVAEAERIRRAQSAQQLWAGMLDGYKQQRSATVRRERAARAALMASTRKVLRRLARRPPLKLPKVPPIARPKYVDLSGKLALVPAMPTVPDFEPSYANYPRYPAFPVPPPLAPLVSCPLGNSITNFGGKGNGAVDESAAFRAASRSSVDYIYLPTGHYKISKTITVTKPIVAGAGAWLDVAAGATLTLAAQPRKADASGALFGGAGSVRLTAPDTQLLPDWFKNWGESDSDAMQNAVDACGGSCTLLLTRALLMNKAVLLRPGVGVYATNVNIEADARGTGEGFVLTPGLYSRPLAFGVFLNFEKFAVKVMGGVTGAELQINAGYFSSDLVQLAPDSNGGISNVFLTHLAVTKRVQNTITFRATSASQEIKNCLLRGNFILEGGLQRPQDQSATLAVLGPAAPRFISTAVVWQAVDTVQFDFNSSHVWVQNAAGTPASNLVYQVQSWGGGMHIKNFGRMIMGDFRGLKAKLDIAGDIPTADHMMVVSGYGNLVTYNWVDSAGREWIMPESTPNKAAYWCPACCQKPDRSTCTDWDFKRGLTNTPQAFYVNAPITRPWPPGEVRTFYLWNVYAQTADNRLGCIPFRAGNPGVMCHGFENQHAQEPGRIAVRLRNAAAYTVAQASHRFGIQIGP